MANNTTNAPSPSMFAYTGHGNEQAIPYNERPPVPPGTTLVLFNKPGQPLPVYDALEIWRVMYNQPDLFKDPIKNKKAIETATATKLRIYPEGAPMPVMNYWPETSMTSRFESPKFFSGGVYRFPLPFPEMQQGSLSNASLSEADVNTYFSGPDNQFLREKILAFPRGPTGRISIQKLKDDLVFTTPEMVTKVGPGIHYFLNCRFVEKLKSRIETLIAPISEKLKKMEENALKPHQKRIKSRLATENEILDYDFRSFRNRFREYETLLQQAQIPENTLPQLRTLLFENSLLEGNIRLDELENAKPESNESFEELLGNPNPADTTWEPENLSSRYYKLKRRSAKQFNAEFGNLQKRLANTRRKSNAYQLSKFTEAAEAAAAVAGAPSTRRGRRRKTRKQRRNTD